MKKSFSLMEVIIAVVMLSVIMLTLLQVKSDNIFMVVKSQEKSFQSDYIQLAININEEKGINKNIFLDRLYRFENEEIRKEIKPIKVKIKDKKVDVKSYDNDIIDLNITTYQTSYSIDDKIKKNIYTFKIEL